MLQRSLFFPCGGAAIPQIHHDLLITQLALSRTSHCYGRALFINVARYAYLRSQGVYDDAPFTDATVSGCIRILG
ncbi:hypothetical protein GAP53_08055 [Bacteroides uniformis]|uniref:Uncharacterized protein n=1 Tax=Bacteroides uniformis TaxID=820 RepID=A0A7J5I9Q4_BACUN|nr:hypothetical protein [Bacteroides uniformis]KAB4219415.1 hypothetical protein GAP45_13190 [Bacteroides uniformis]KAB4222888.1 hypothetical protein GAP53_08055 [Bacteroides uniformis]KAB4225192.1 hypothetical protein GAP44_19255 [Bacteroides uniformis]KAB4236234.1 hypothetical protein GAP54_19340 [Bacteroides uniformis]KAB4241594.1 hypothetical protein GAP41_12650 [Bacteroides uniformis]